MKKIFKKNKIGTFKIIKDNNLQSLPRMFLSCLIVISFFYSLPMIINFTNNSAGIENNSKAILAYTLNNQTNDNSKYPKFNEDDLLIDIYSLNDQETDSVRLDAQQLSNCLRKLTTN